MKLTLKHPSHQNNKLLNFVYDHRKPIAGLLIIAMLVPYIISALMQRQEGSENLLEQFRARQQVEQQSRLLESFTAEVTAQDYELALTHINELLDLEPEIGDYYLKRASLYVMLEDKDAALIDLDQAIFLDASLYDAYALRATLSSEAGNYEAALADYRKMYQLSPENAELLMYIADCFQQIPDYTKAIATYDQAQEKLPAYTSAISYARGVCYYSIGDYEHALSDLLTYYSEHSEDTELNFLIGSCYMNLMDDTLAESYLLASSTSGSKITESSYYLGIIRLDQEDYLSAIDYLTVAVNDDFMKDFALYNRAVCYLCLDNTDPALSDLQEALILTEDETIRQSINYILEQLEPITPSA